MQRMREQARLQEELAKRKSMEEELKAQKQQQVPVAEGDLESLQRVTQQQKEKIERLEGVCVLHVCMSVCERGKERERASCTYSITN